YPPGYLEAMANKTKREATVRSVGGSKRGRKRGRPRSTRPSKRVQEEEEEEEEEEEKPAEHTEEELQSNGSADAHEEEKTGVCEPQEEPQVKRRKEVESFVLSEQQRNLIRDDEPNRKLWDEALSFLSEGPNFLRKVEQLFMCVCCQELSFQPVTTECSHNVCKYGVCSVLLCLKTCLQRSVRGVFSCPPVA
ncbi:hypothetical protein cypCar_00029942, partial [Cyprinus carpio]